MKNYKKGEASPHKQPSLNMLRELRGNAVQLQVPTTNKPGQQPPNYEDPNYLAAQQYYQQQSGDMYMNPQRSPVNFDNNALMQLQTPQLVMGQQDQQRAYVNAHGGGLIPPANFSENPFTSYLKSVGATVGQTHMMQPSLEAHEEKPKVMPADKHMSLTEMSSSSRNQRRQGAQSLQPLAKAHSRQDTFNEQSDAAFSRIQLKDKLTRNVTQTIDHDVKPRRRPVDILTNNLDAEEIRALRVANPLHHAFNNHLGQVITSVKQRRRLGDQESQMLALQDSKVPHELAVNRSEAEAFMTQPQQRLQLTQDESHAGQSQDLVPFVQNTPSRVIAEARRELALIKDKPTAQSVKAVVPKPISLFKPQLKDEFVPQQRTVDQVANLLARVNRNKDQIFIPLELEQDPDIGGVKFRDAKNQDEVKAGQVVFTKNGFISIAPNKNLPTEVVSKETYIQEGVQQMVLNQVPFFRKFQALKTFKSWKLRTQRNVFNRTRQKLARNYIFSKPVFAHFFKNLVENANEVRYLKLIDTKPGVQYGKHQTALFDQQCLISCKESKEKLERGLKRIWTTLEGLKRFIAYDDNLFIESCKKVEETRIITEKQHELVLMTKTRAAKDAEDRERDLMLLRQKQYNALVQLISRIIFNNLTELLIENKRAFTNMFCAPKALTQFEVSLCLDANGRLTTAPTQQEHRQLFAKVFQQMEETLFKNYYLTAYFQDLVQMFFWEDKWTNPPGALLMRRQIAEIESLIGELPEYLKLDEMIDKQLTIDLAKLEEQLAKYQEVEEVYSFTHDWNERRQRLTQKSAPEAASTEESSVSQEIEFYNQTWSKLHYLNGIIEQIPVSHTKIGTIVMETASLKKMLSEMPKQIDESIRTNVTQTIDSETKILKEELSSTSDTLDKIPSTLNVYVDQVNTLKYLKEKQKDFDKKFQTIEKLQAQCKQDNIKIAFKVQLNIEEVAQLHRNLPALKEKAQEGLKMNKLAIEQSMFRSSEGLSLKIKAFEKKYVETYLQDKTRLERCKETLDELLRRSQAVLEMKSKVVLYKEFLKILYEDDKDAEEKLSRRKLSCASDCEFMEEIHKNTIKMWKVFLYWTKKRHQCFTTPFLDFDLKIILKAINKVTKFLADQATQSEVVAYKAQPVTRAINTQVKDTSVIVEFVKEMNKDTLKRRHWSQIFSLLKAPHLKNSTAFTIVDLREYNIQNNANDVRAIIDHANTEAKYENVFLTIKNEWEQSQLKIVPFKEQVNDYIIVSSELMSDAIEDNLSTLDTIARSPYATHVTSEIQELITKLRQMLEHLLAWTQAQKYWLTLDPIYNSGLFRNFFQAHTQDFLDTRAQFRRIMWSAFRRPKTTYNLMIKDRLPVFQHLVHFYAMIQKQTNNYLEQKRLLFSRFYFLNDSQFLELMMLQNSNQDYSCFVQMLFQGAQKLFVTRLLKDQDVKQTGALSYEAQVAVEPDYLSDLEGQLEKFLNEGRRRAHISNSTGEGQQAMIEAEHAHHEANTAVVLNSKYDFDKLDSILAKPVADSQKKNEPTGDRENFHQHPGDAHHAMQQDHDSDGPASETNKSIGFDGDSVALAGKTQSEKQTDTEAEHLQIYKDMVDQRQALFNKKHHDLAINSSTQDFIVLGFVSSNKELFLFDQHVSMSKPLESWLAETELAMQDSLRKQMIDSIENFTREPLEEWVLDYPQQIALSTMHLILSQEITDILQNSDYGSLDEKKLGTAGTSQQPKADDDDTKSKDPKTSGDITNTNQTSQQQIPNTMVRGYEEVAIQIGAKTNEDKKKGQTIQRKQEEKKAQVVIRKRPTFEPDHDVDELQVSFIDETFGPTANIEDQLDAAITIMKKDDRYLQNNKKSALNVRKPDYKEQVLQVLQHKGLHSLALRLQFWINKMLKLLYAPTQNLDDPTQPKRSLEMPGILKLRIKNLILFLRHQQEQVDTLISLKVTNVNDFEWQSKLRMTWTNDYEAQAVCGGWSLNIGYEYLGSNPRVILTPLTQRYFVFMASALREKQSAMLNCSNYESTGSEIVKEFASLCMLPFKSHQCTPANNLSSLTQLLNGAAMANTWVFFEHIDHLPLEKLQIVIKEIQLLHEQFIVSGFTRNLLKERIAKQAGIDFTQMSSASIAGANKKNQMVTLGIFASTTPAFLTIKTPNATVFQNQTRASFRSIGLAKPDMTPLVFSLLMSENFTSPRKMSQLITNVLKRFFELKELQLRESVQAGQNQTLTQVDLSTLKQVVRVAALLRNQEVEASTQATLKAEVAKTLANAKEEHRPIWIEQNDLGGYEIRKKLRDQYLQERADNTILHQTADQTKFQIELNCLAESFKQISTQKYLPELLAEEQFQQLTNRGKKLKQLNLDVKEQEQLLEELVVQAFTEVIKVKVEYDRHIEDEKEKAQSLNLESGATDNAYGNSKDPKEVSQLGSGDKIQQTRAKMQLVSTESLAKYEVKIKATQSRQDETKNEKSTSKLDPNADEHDIIIHKTSTQMTHSAERNERESKFALVLQQGIRQVATELNYDLTDDQMRNCVSIVEAMKRSKGIVVSGPVCSGKTQLIKMVTMALKKIFSAILRTSYLSPSTFSQEDFYGPVLAFDQSALQQLDQALQPQSVFQIILSTYAREKKLMSQQERDRTIQAFYIDQQDLAQDCTDSFKGFLQATNLRQRDYLSEQEFLLELDNLESRQLQPSVVQNVPVRFPNGNVTLFPSDLYMFFECHSLKNASPSFLSEVQIVSTQQDDILYTHLFQYKLRVLELKHAEKLKVFEVEFKNLKECCKDFVLPFMRNLNKHSGITSWSLWNIKSLTLALFKQLDAQLHKLAEWAAYFKMLDDGSFPIDEMQRDALWNIVLTATVWSLGAVLNKDLRQVFDDQFGIFKSKFNITFSNNTKMRYKLFDIFYDIQKLQWSIFSEKLEYKLKSYFEPALQALLLPTTQVSQAFYMLDTQVSYMRADKNLDKAFRLIGPHSSSKTVILNTFATKMQAASHSVSVPMSAYLTLDLFKERVEENYRKKRENALVPRDPSKQILLIIDDVHLQKNLQLELLEFLRSWGFCRGYFSVANNSFKKVADFGTIMAENFNFQPNTKKDDRFLFYATTLFTEEIPVDQYKLFIQSWLTSNYWPVSSLISKYYLLISNALMMLLEKMKQSENIVDCFGFSTLLSFHYVAKFCSNLVLNCSLTDAKVDVYGQTAEGIARKEEEAVADLFCHEVQRTYGDRMMRPTAKQFINEKLAHICQKEFLCDDNYNGAYLEQLVLGNYHVKEDTAHHKMSSVMTPFQRDEARSLLRQKCRKMSGNTFLPQLLDSPQGLADCYRVSRPLYKPQQHLMVLGQVGTSKLEMVQLAAVTNNVPLFEVQADTYGAPLQFAYNLRQVLLSVAKMNRASYIVINDQTVRDPLYFDYIYNFLSQLARHESFVMFDDQFFIDLAAIEAQHIKKMRTVAVPDEYVLFKQAVQKLQKHVHFCFVFSELLTYKEIVQMWPQMEYLFEVVYLEDLTQKDYHDMAQSYMTRAQVPEEIQGDDQQFGKALVEVRNKVKQQVLKNYYSPAMLRYTMREEYHTSGASEYIFNDGDKLQLNIYTDSKGYQVSDPDLTQILLNLPLEVTALNKHRFGLFYEVTKFLFDLMSMHLSSRKSYYETFLAKSRQFHKYFSSVKESKRGLHDDQANHSFRVAMAADKIKNIRQALQDKQTSIQKKNTEIEELQEELNVAEEEVETVIMEKNYKLDKTMEELSALSYDKFAAVAQMDKLMELELALFKLLNVIIREEHEVQFSRREALAVFANKEELISILEERRSKSYSRPIFDKLSEFVANRIALEYSESPIMFILFNYLVELYRKMNIKNTMSQTFSRIKEIRNQIDSNVFSIQYAQQSIETKNQELKQQQRKLGDLEMVGSKLSRKIEEAELSYMRTDQIFTNIETYSRRLDHKLTSLSSRTQTLLGDSILLACSVVYLGGFAPEERETFRAQLVDYLQKVRNIHCNKMWTEQSSLTQTALPNKSMFIQVLKDLGLRDILYKHNMPGVLSQHQFGEALFGMLFAPSCPVICDPTGVVEQFVKEKLLSGMDCQTIKATDIEAGKKLEAAMALNKPAVVLDVNAQAGPNSGLTHPHSVMRVLANPLYNGVDFDSKRLAQAKKIGAFGSFTSHGANQNKRIPIVSAALEHISLYQAQVFQSRFDFQLTADFTQNATFICAAPSLIVENRVKMEDNIGIVKLKELLLDRLLPASHDFAETKAQLASLNKRILQLERNYENAFLVASGETFKNIAEYSSLRQSVEDIIEAREQKTECLKRYREALKQVKLVTEASDVLFQIYLVLKLVGKQCRCVTYSWQRYLQVVDSLLLKLVDNLRLDAYQAKKGDREDDEVSEAEVEIDNSFFKRRFVPAVHQTMVASLASTDVPLFNFFLALRLAHTYKAISALEHQFVLRQLVELKGYKQWRQPDHQFIQLHEGIDKTRLQALRRELLRLYPDVARQVFDQIEKTLGSQFKYVDASIFIQKELKEKYNLTQVQQLTFGFLCPDSEFKSKLTLFMYTQCMATFDFTEEVTPLGDFLSSADFPAAIALRTSPKINPVNLITTLAHTHGRSLVVLRTDPSHQSHKFNTQVFNGKLQEKLSSQLLDYSTVRQNIASSVDDRAAREQSLLPLDDKEILSKQVHLAVQQRDVNLDEGKIFFSEGENSIESADKNNPHIQQVTDAAQQGNWVLLCPVQFPHFITKLCTQLEHMHTQGLMSPDFRLIIDLQNYNQNEVPDSFTFRECVAFSLNEQNYDRVQTLSDIWSKILNPTLLEKLTDTQQGNSELAKIAHRPEGTQEPSQSTQFMQVFSKEVNDQNSVNLFNKFIERSTVDFTQKLKFQRVQTLERLKAEKEAQLEAQRVREEQEARKAEQEAKTTEVERKSVTALSNESQPKQQPGERPATSSLELKQEVAAIDLAAKVAAVGEEEGARLDYDAQQEQRADKNEEDQQERKE